jgi:hypothetical protein
MTDTELIKRASELFPTGRQFSYVTVLDDGRVQCIVCKKIHPKVITEPGQTCNCKSPEQINLDDGWAALQVFRGLEVVDDLKAMLVQQVMRPEGWAVTDDDWVSFYLRLCLMEATSREIWQINVLAKEKENE